MTPLKAGDKVQVIYKSGATHTAIFEKYCAQGIVVESRTGGRKIIDSEEIHVLRRC